jgi:cytosol alanyl aminopeptidase
MDLMFSVRLALALCSASAFAAEAPKLRLPDDIRPIKYAADLTLIPGEKTFSGAIDIDVALAKPASLIWLNATELTIQQATIASQPAAIEPGNDDFVGLRAAKILAPGPARIHIVYQGKISEKSSAGIFQGLDGKQPYLFTQFESIDARRAFPCFDQPDFKTPWQITVHVPKDHAAVSNTSPISETDEPRGMKKVVFAPTRPLPSYLVAMAVGPFEFVDAGKAGAQHIPVRIVTPKGKANQAKYAAEVTATIIDRLESYFGIPFPFEKCDNVAIPLTFGFGAMENAGMVTYAQTLILADPAIDTEQRQRTYASVAAHELAHQWFGDLVTLAWWDDTWLNEAFATWTSAKIIAEWKPEWRSRLSDLNGKFGAMGEDSLVAARKIRQPIESKDDISNAFDGITYQKGASVIRMFESWVGEKKFQAGVTAYLKRYSYKNARVGDFLDAIAATGQPELTRAFSTYLEQPGFPLISVNLNCSAAPMLAFNQKRYLPTGSAGNAKQVWQTPVCVRYQTAKGDQKECFLLDKPAAEFKLTHATSCPANLSANADAAGNYITRYDAGLLAKLLGGDYLNAAERMTLLNDLTSLLNAGEIAQSDVLTAAAAFAKAPERQIVGLAQSAIGGTRRFLPANLLPNYARFVQKTFGARADQLGWSAKPGEDSDAALQRAGIVPFVAAQGDDAALRDEARRLAAEWLKTRKGIDANMVNPVLTTAAQFGDRALFDTMTAELKKTTDRQQRGRILGAMGSFRDAAIARAGMEMVLHSEIDIRESLSLLVGPLGARETEKLPFEFVKANYDELVKHLPTGGGFDAGAMLPFVGGSACDEASRQEFVGFFDERARKFTGGQHSYDQVLESIRLCEAQKSARAADIAAFFAKQ